MPTTIQVFWVAVVQCAVILWMHHAALSLNMQRLRRHIGSRVPDIDGAVWITTDASGHGFRLCRMCVDAVFNSPHGSARVGDAP